MYTNESENNKQMILNFPVRENSCPLVAKYFCENLWLNILSLHAEADANEPRLQATPSLKLWRTERRQAQLTP